MTCRTTARTTCTESAGRPGLVDPAVLSRLSHSTSYQPHGDALLCMVDGLPILGLFEHALLSNKARISTITPASGKQLCVHVLCPLLGSSLGMHLNSAASCFESLLLCHKLHVVTPFPCVEDCTDSCALMPVLVPCSCASTCCAGMVEAAFVAVIHLTEP